MTYGGAAYANSAYGSTVTTTDPAGRVVSDTIAGIGGTYGGFAYGSATYGGGDVDTSPPAGQVVSDTSAGSSGTYGGFAYGSNAYGGDTEDTQEITAVSIPARTVNVNRTPVGATGAGTGTALAPVRHIEQQRTTPDITGTGIGTANTPNRDITLARNTITPTGAGTSSVLAPIRTVESNRNAVTTTGAGTGTAAAPARTINAERTPPAVTGAGTGTATAPLRVLEVGRTEPTVTGVGLAAEDREVGGGGTYGGFGYGGAAYGSNQAKVEEQSALTIPARTLEAQRESPTFTGAGTVGTALPPRTLEVSRGEINVLFVVGLPNRDLEVSRTTPDVTGLGTVTTDLPLRTLEILRQSPGFGFEFWVVDDDTLRTPTSETASDTTLSIVFRVESSTLNDTLRPLKSDQGKAKLLRTDDGGFTVVDRANGGNTFDVRPPVNRLPLRQRSDYHVESYEESLVSQTVDEWDVELELLRTANRTDNPSINETRASDEWAFDTRYGQIATERVDAEFVGRGEGGVRRFEITARLTKDQSYVFEAALNRLGGARVRDIPDATNVAVDDTDDDAATLGVTSPVSDTIVADGDYVVQEWQSRRLNDGFQEIEFVISET